MRITKSRPYRMRRRAELVDQTRQRITEAAARLHTSVGPAHTSIASIAEAAGVTRVTVYRHFADLDVLFEACRAHWRDQNPPPDASRWLGITELEPRVHLALTGLYSWFREHAEELFPIYRDSSTMPPAAQDRLRDDHRRLGDLLVAGIAPDGERGRQIRSVARHLVSYPTWRSLAVDQGLSDSEVVEIGVRLLAVVTEPSDRKRRSRRRPPG